MKKIRERKENEKYHPLQLKRMSVCRLYQLLEHIQQVKKALAGSSYNFQTEATARTFCELPG